MRALTASEILAAGVEKLRPIFEPHGFVYFPGAAGASSGGPFASGAFVAGDRRVNFSFRYSLGPVTYTLGTASISHQDFLRYADEWGKHRYPNFGGEPIESFRALAHDLLAFFTDFLGGSGVEFQRVVAARTANPKKFSGFSALGLK